MPIFLQAVQSQPDHYRNIRCTGIYSRCSLRNVTGFGEECLIMTIICINDLNNKEGRDSEDFFSSNYVKS